jgi:hypothetical protein
MIGFIVFSSAVTPLLLLGLATAALNLGASAH